MKKWFLFLLFPWFGCQVEQGVVEGWHEPVVPVSLYYTMHGKVWAPGGDLMSVLDANRMPVPDALVALFREEPQPPPGRYYCNRCVELPPGTQHTRTDVDGSFEIQVRPNTEYWMVVQKGEFRRVTKFVSGRSGEVWDSEEEKSGPRPSIVTLPSVHEPVRGKWIPRILILKGRGEPDMGVFWKSLGFLPGVDVEEISDREAEWVVSSPEMLRNYSILLATCGDEATYLTKPQIQENLRNWVKNGGKLFVDDFAYDWAEQLFPGFMSFKVDYTLDFETGVCGGTERAPNEVGRCVNYECYDASGYPGDDQLAEWIDVVNRYSPVSMKYGCNVIHELGTGEQGICKTELDPRCRDGLFYDVPKVWMFGTSIRYQDKPLTVSWNYHCGKVMYTVLHTHAEGSSSVGYELLLQEKVMMYLFMELQTCTSPNLVE
ncbi:MAG: hypothetical protein CVU65_08175 [Deltaproteobacteria bacterium HGW-Deltaproteobacteria-22]|jgi:hypothetical protein|nr:MAG: hypothetical protein CVU65_08175 [Deltaproteobacteria bacterium HGW-Deltaproteobacteria-22]